MQWCVFALQLLSLSTGRNSLEGVRSVHVRCLHVVGDDRIIVEKQRQHEHVLDEKVEEKSPLESHRLSMNGDQEQQSGVNHESFESLSEPRDVSVFLILTRERQFTDLACFIVCSRRLSLC